MLLAIRSDDDVELLVDLIAEEPSVTVVALLDPQSAERLNSCIGAGARGCVSMDWSDQDVVLALNVGMRGMAVLPAMLARNLATNEKNRAHARSLTSSQQTWLRELASGITVHELASQVGFSERETYRRLRLIYLAMGVRTRTEALILASASGLLNGPSIRDGWS
jgi:DNA-binding NarL/FixJ family response regulator